MENNNKQELTDKEITLAQIKIVCVKTASKHSYSFTDILKQTKELLDLIKLS